MTTSQLSLLLSAGALFTTDALLFDQLTTIVAIVAIVAPVFGTYATAYISYVAGRSKARTTVDPQVSTEFSTLTIGLCILFSVIALFLVWSKGLGLFSMSFEQFKGLFGLTELIVGGMASRLYFSQYRSAAA